MQSAETIAAVATAPGRAGIGVIRLSGDKVAQLCKAITGRLPAERHAQLSDFLDSNGDVIDRGIAIYFGAPRSYTGEDVLELQAHGGTAVLRLLLQRCLQLGARVAEPGEFTKRAFLNNKIDLAQAESVADLIDASSADAVKSAQRSLTGEFSNRVSGARDALIELRSVVEAVLDFPEEEVDLIERHQVRSSLERISSELSSLSANAAQGNLLRDGVHVVLVGAPNVGKSSLMNRLAEEEVSIVTDVPGTTRDVLRRELVIGGVPVHVIDTAGLRPSDDPVERIGVERSVREIELADLAIEVREAIAEQEEIDESVSALMPSINKKIIVINKIDLVGTESKSQLRGDSTLVWTSAKTGTGIEALREAILVAIGRQPTEEAPFLARERHIHALDKAIASIERASQELARLEFFAEELRLAQIALGEITGDFTADDLLGEIFSRFCIGK